VTRYQVVATKDGKYLDAREFRKKWIEIAPAGEYEI
jgi:hypothetical protein